jgi:predicted TIM-barrel fold metal-dependent hydrolase
MLIVDAQVHIWRNNKPTNPSHRQVTDYTTDAVLREMDEELIMGRAVCNWLGWNLPS